MDFGVMMFPTDETIGPVDIGQAAELRGFESVWFPEHSHIPTSRATPWGGREGAPPLPREYWRSYDQMTALAAVAATTSTIKVATGICLVAQRDPIWTAKEVASIDAISSGRMMFGIGYGWNKEELAHHGVAYNQRRARLRECVLAMKAIWTEDEASFEGEHVNFSPIWSWPKPVTSPHPPVILGGSAGPKTAAHIAEFCDGFMPIGTRDFGPALEEINKACDKIGRDPKTIELGVFGAKPTPEAIESLMEQGVSRAVFGLPQGKADEVLPAMDKLAELASSFSD